MWFIIEEYYIAIIIIWKRNKNIQIKRFWLRYKQNNLNGLKWSKGINFGWRW